MRSLRKVVPYEDLGNWRAHLQEVNRPLVVTNGCFDLLHPGHLFLLEKARELGKTLLVGVTGDEAIRNLKGPGRPAMPGRDRLLLLSSLEAVSNVCLFPEIDAVAFLQAARPDIYVKGGDYTLDSINQEERRLLEGAGVKIQIIPRVELQSSSAILQRIVKSATDGPFAA
jgi:D-beta-D-heptose 7-phosphate kinase/D-beta-D-heptose 1-phosphate adenosyltransferase